MGVEKGRRGHVEMLLHLSHATCVSFVFFFLLKDESVTEARHLSVTKTSELQTCCHIERLLYGVKLPFFFFFFKVYSWRIRGIKL